MTPVTRGSALIFKATVVMFLIQLCATLIFMPRDFLGALWRGPHMGLLIALGASSPDLSWWGPLTANFLHGGILHLAMNMMALYYIGPLIESLTSRSFFISTYIGSGVVGFISSAFLGGVSVGASAAIFGLLGCGFVHTYFYKSSRHPLFALFTSWILMGLAFGLLVPRVDSAAHLGGLVGGCLWGLLWVRSSRILSMPKVFTITAFTLAAGTLLGLIASLSNSIPLFLYLLALR